MIINSLSGYVGGKVKLAPKLISYFKPHKWYLELFAGMMSVFLYKGNSERNIINDINNNVINLFTVARDRPEELIKLIELTPYSSKIYWDYAHLYTNKWEEIDELRRALIYLYLLRHTFNSQVTSFSYTTTHIQSNAWGNNSMLQNIRNFAKRCQGVEFTNYDFKKVLSTPWLWENADKLLIYADPPYYVATEVSSYYEYIFTTEDHTIFRDMITDMANKGVSVVISYDAHPKIYELYKDKPWTIHEIKDVVQSASNKDGAPVKRTELVIVNYDILEVGLFANNII